MLVRRKRVRAVKQVGPESINTLSTRLACRLLFHHLHLLRQIHDGDEDVWVVTHALQSPTACIAAHVQERLGLVGKHDLQSLLERAVAIEMVKAEPTLLHLFRQLRQSFVDGRPVAEML